MGGNLEKELGIKGDLHTYPKASEIIQTVRDILVIKNEKLEELVLELKNYKPKSKEYIITHNRKREIKTHISSLDCFIFHYDIGQKHLGKVPKKPKEYLPPVLDNFLK